MKRVLGLVLSLLAAAATAAAATPAQRPWTSDDILAMKAVSDPQVSPDGRFVAYVVDSLNDEKDAYQTDVWLVPTAGGEARPLTSAPQNDDTPRWSPDGKWIAFLSERPRPGAKKDEADEAKRQVWLIRPDGGEPRPLTSAPGSVSDLAWSRDGKTIGFVAREPKSEDRRRREKDKDDAWTPAETYPWARLWVIDVASREARQLTRGDLHVAGFSFSPDGQRIAFAGQPTPLIPDSFNSDLYVVPVAGGEPKPLVQRPGAEAARSGRPTGSGSPSSPRTAGGPSGSPTTTSASCPPRAERRALSPLAWSWTGSGAREAWRGAPDSASLLVASLERTASQVLRVTLDGNVTPLTKGPELSSAPSLDAKGQTLAFLREDSERPREVWTIVLPAGTPRALTDTNPQVRDLLAFRKERVTWKGADGWDIDGLLVYPAGYKPGTRVPLVLNVHGGPAGTHTNNHTAAARIWGWPLFAQKGFALLFPNPRGSGGYGERFRGANVRDWGGKDYEDLMLGVDAMVERGIADPQHLAVTGWSYGGFMTSTIVTKTDRFKAAIVGAAVTDLASFTGTTDIPDFSRSYFGAWPWEDPQLYVDHSAFFHAGKVKTPSLVVHGDKDERVPTSQGWEFYTALKKVGVPTELLILPRQPHGPREPRLLRTCHERFVAWIERYAGGR